MTEEKKQAIMNCETFDELLDQEYGPQRTPERAAFETEAEAFCIMKKGMLLLALICAIFISCSDHDTKVEEVDEILFTDEFKEVSELPTWMKVYIDDFTEVHPTGLDIYQGEMESKTIYMIMTVFYNTPYVYDQDGNYIGLTPYVRESSKSWKRIYSWRPENWPPLQENDMSITRYLTIK